MTKKEILKLVISVLIAALTALAAGLGLSSCNACHLFRVRKQKKTIRCNRQSKAAEKTASQCGCKNVFGRFLEGIRMERESLQPSGRGLIDVRELAHKQIEELSRSVAG